MTARKPARRATARPAAPAAKAAQTAAATSPATQKAPPQLQIVEHALDDMKAVDVRVLDVRGMTDIADWMVIASGNSDRHVRSIADRVVEQAKASGKRPFGVEGSDEGEWVLVDLPDVMVHVMLPRVREFYALEQLWERPAAKAAASAPAATGKPRRAGNGKPRAAAPRREDGGPPRGRRGGAAKRRPASAG
ncbi:MAG: ribosome silencing factor [Steroidobacteraceae bacterium]